MRNIFISSAKNSWKRIMDHKLLSFSIIFLQIIFLGLWFANQLYFQVQINDKLVTVFEKAEKELPSEQNITTGFFSGTPLVSQNFFTIEDDFQELVSLLRNFLIVAAIIFSVVNGVVWTATSGLFVQKKWKEYLQDYGTFVIVSACFFLFLVVVFQASIASLSFETPDRFTTSTFMFIIVSFIIYYFMNVSFALIGKKSLKELPLATLSIGVKKIIYIILLYCFIFLCYLIPLYLMVTFIEHIFVITLVILLLLLIMFILRVFFIEFVHQLDSGDVSEAS